jgi:sialate O-acetylesterase
VEIAGNAGAGVAGADGRWQVRIQPPSSGGPYKVKITGRQHVELHEVLVGDVWLCGGQFPPAGLSSVHVDWRTGYRAPVQ